MKNKNQNKEIKLVVVSNIIATIILLVAVIIALSEPVEGNTKVPMLNQNIDKIIDRREPDTKSIGTYTITHYCACVKCCGKTNGITASGAMVQANRTIAAPSTFPFGTVLIIDGIEYVVEDRGGAINGNRLDIYVESHEEALQRGIIKRDVLVYQE